MTRVLSVRIDRRHVVLRCEAKEGNYKIGDSVLIDTKEGTQIGSVILEPRELSSELFGKPVCKVLRVVTEEDLQKQAEEEKKGVEALKICEQKIERLDLPMKLVDVRFHPRGDKITFFFTAESRVNFRDLVKQLAAEFHAQIEMRQIGARNEAKTMGGVGCCGRPICCASFLEDFDPVTIRMAKDQGLSLDPAKISGLCGRLLCCLAYESEGYAELIKTLPKGGSTVKSVHGEGRVVKLNVLAQSVTLELADGRQMVVRADELRAKDTKDTKEPKETKGNKERE
jgi:cell fate regulator YaaT (PSP1 superfamily)